MQKVNVRGDQSGDNKETEPESASLMVGGPPSGKRRAGYSFPSLTP